MIREDSRYVAPGKISLAGQQISSEMLGEQTGKGVQQPVQDTNPGREKMEGTAPARRSAQHERKRKIQDGRGSHATCFAPIKTRMSQKYADAADGKTEKAEGVDPMGDANQGRMPRRIQNICVLDCDP
jgi:hypothetical protein